MGLVEWTASRLRSTNGAPCPVVSCLHGGSTITGVACTRNSTVGRKRTTSSVWRVGASMRMVWSIGSGVTRGVNRGVRRAGSESSLRRTRVENTTWAWKTIVRGRFLLCQVPGRSEGLPDWRPLLTFLLIQGSDSSDSWFTFYWVFGVDRQL